MNELKVQFCCGGNLLDGWRNHDQDSADITKRLPYDDNAVDFILIEHGLEHVNCACGQLFLVECYRILKPGGTLRVCVPEPIRVLGKSGDEAHVFDLIIGHGHQMVYSLGTLNMMLSMAGFRFSNIHETPRRDCDQHWKTIGLEKDDLETLRVEAVK